MQKDKDGIYIDRHCRLMAREYKCVKAYERGCDDKAVRESLFMTQSTLARTKKTIREKVSANSFLQAMLIIAKHLPEKETHNAQ